MPITIGGFMESTTEAQVPSLLEVSSVSQTNISPLETKEMKDRKNKLKLLFRSYRKMTPHIERGLLELGIKTARQRNHIVLLVNGRSIPIGCTVSDRRVGKKIVSTIMSCY